MSILPKLAGVVLAGGLAACGAVADRGPVGVRSSTHKAAGASSGAAALARANAAFAGRLYAALARENKTFAFSPYSIAAALAMTSAGAEGNTLHELERALGMDAKPLPAAFRALDRGLRSRAGNGVRLDVANALWGQRGTRFGREFLDTLERNYGAGMQVVDYRSDPTSARNAINAWVAQHTRGKITDLLAPGTVDALTRLVLVDAVYLKARWALPFDHEATTAGTFHAPGGRVPTRLMHNTGQFGYRRGRGFQVVELPYRGNRLEMDIILPDAGRMAAVERVLAARGIGRLVDGAKRTEVALGLPKVKLASRFDLVDTLRTLGVRDLFTDRADLSAISKDEPLAVSGVVHQATLAVDEDGTEASAATGVVVRAVSAPVAPSVTVTVDRPFLFALRDRSTGALLFLGRVKDPGVRE